MAIDVIQQDEIGSQRAAVTTAPPRLRWRAGGHSGERCSATGEFSSP